MTDPVSLFENSASDGIVFLVDGDAIAVATDDHHSPLVSLHSVERHGTLNKRHREIARAVRAAHRAIERARQFVTHPTPTPPSTGHHTITRKQS